MLSTCKEEGNIETLLQQPLLKDQLETEYTQDNIDKKYTQKIIMGIKIHLRNLKTHNHCIYNPEKIHNKPDIPV